MEDMLMLKITKILMDYETSQIGITHVPQFGWVLESDKRNVVQESYELQIAADQAFAEPVYESGEVKSDASAQVETKDTVLASQTRYYVRVRVAAGGERTDWYSTSFVTGMMDNSQWKAEFISAEEEADKDNSKGTYVRKTFRLKGKVKEAFACTTALGLYNFYINGKK